MQYNSSTFCFKEFENDDFESFYSVFSNEKVMYYALMDRFTTKEEGRNYFEKILTNNHTTLNREAYDFAIYLQDSKEFIGYGVVEVYSQNAAGGIGEIGYFLLPPYWGKGYATEIAKILVEIGFKEIKLHRIMASCNAGNQSSEKIMKKIGMSKEGVFRKGRFKHGSWHDELRYSILLEEWEAESLKF